MHRLYFLGLVEWVMLPFDKNYDLLFSYQSFSVGVLMSNEVEGD